MIERVPLRPISLFALILVVALLLGLFVPTDGRSEAPEGRSEAPAGQLTWAVHFSLAPTWFDPAATTAIIPPSMSLYALHDSLVNPIPRKPLPAQLPPSR